MFRFFLKSVCLVVIIALAFATLSLTSGGEVFRTLGRKAQEGSEFVAKAADRFKEQTERYTGKHFRSVRSLLGKKKDEKSR